MRKPESMVQLTPLVKPGSEELLRIKLMQVRWLQRGLIYLPGGMQVTGAMGGTENAGIQYLINGEVNPTDVLIATYVGAFTRNTGLKGRRNRRWRRRCSADTVYTAGTLTRICVASPRYPGRGWRGHYATTSISIITGWKRRLK